MTSKFYEWGQNSTSGYIQNSSNSVTTTTDNSTRETPCESDINSVSRTLSESDELEQQIKLNGTLRGQVKVLTLARKNAVNEIREQESKISLLEYENDRLQKKIDAKTINWESEKERMTIALEKHLCKVELLSEELASLEKEHAKISPIIYTDYFQINAINTTPLKSPKDLSLVYTRPSGTRKIYFRVIGKQIEINKELYTPCIACKDIPHFQGKTVLIYTKLLYKLKPLERLLATCSKKHSY